MSRVEYEYAYAILDCFEKLLDDKDIDIPSDDREGNDGEARLYGAEYYELETMIIELLEKYKKEVTG